MKKTFQAFMLIGLLSAGTAFAQDPAAPADKDGFSNGQVVLANNTTVSGPVKENIRKKGELVVMVDGKKVKYKASDISSARIGSSNYIAANYTFYELVAKGSTLSLYRKASQPDGIQFNGSEPISISSEGNIDDLFIAKVNGGMQLLTKKNYKELLGEKCASMVGSFESGAVKKAIEVCGN